MTWKCEEPVSEIRFAFVHAVVTAGLSVVQACRQFRVSRKTGHKWLARYRQQPQQPLVDRSRRPQSCPARTAEAIEQAVLELRDRHGWGAAKIHALLGPQIPSLPCPRTVTRILRRHGRMSPAPAPSPAADQRFQRPEPNQLWQLDFKGPCEVQHQRICPLTILDDHSRYLLALVACRDQTHQTTWEVLWRVLGEVGMPEALLADNAFGNRQSYGLGLSGFDVRLIRCGIQPLHGRPYHPQTQGKVERFHGTLERELWPQIRRDDLGHFQADLDHWRMQVYNSLRPHEALDQRPPVTSWRPSLRPRPDRLPEVEYPAGAELRKVFAPGLITWRHRRIRVGQGLIGQWVRLEVRDASLLLFYAWKEVRNLVIDQLDRYTVN